jgi:hypothetical protein
MQPTILNLLETQGLQQGHLLNNLDELFPPVTPNPEMTIELIMYRAGQRSVIEYIQQQMEQD